MAGLIGTLVVGGPTGARADQPESPTRLVNVAADGTPVKATATDPSLSADGRFVAFVSDGTGLTGVDPRGWRQIYRRDLQTGAIDLVSRDAGAATLAGDLPSFSPSISADGRFVAFASMASNLDAKARPNEGKVQVYVRDMRVGGATRMVSLNAAMTAGGASGSGSPVISADGSRIAFTSDATDLVAGSAFAETQIFVSDVPEQSTSSIRLVSLQDSSRLTAPDVANRAASDPSISGDGRLITFTSRATNLRTTPVSGSVDQGFVHDTATGSTRLVTSSADGSVAGDGSSSYLAISADGTRIAFASLATNLLSGAVPGLGQAEQVFVRDTAGATPSILVSSRINSSSPGNDRSLNPAISADGHRVAFSSGATDLTRANIRQSYQLFLRDTELRSTIMLGGTWLDGLDGATGNLNSFTLSGDGELAAFNTTSKGLTEAEVSGFDSLLYTSRVPVERVDRLGGPDRYAASAAISADTFGPEAAVAYIASGANYPDALSGSVAAGLAGGPVLLVTKDAVPGAVADELRRLQPKKIVILGGVNSVGAGVEQALGAFSPSVSRIGGADRYVVSAAISAQTFPGPDPVPVAYLASGENFPDALSGSARAGREGGPVLLTTKGIVPDAVRSELARLKPGAIVILGGENSISAAVADSLKPIAPVSRIGGADRYVVSAAISATRFEAPSATVYVALGATFPDALSGSAAAVTSGAPVLLVTTDGIPDPVRDEIRRLKPHRIVVLGGPNSVSPGVETQLADLLGR
ncbi:cell wall-binding repeat-containing protein [Herbiconiux sp. P15]|uniref:cell wall-binding repeat-containing protein n=1 Tax=Herbiconiux liukaitaii TaxID=3342799 RepID=UPI0035B6F31E